MVILAESVAFSFPECMKDLIRFLRLDPPETCTVRRQLGRMQTVQKDLLPILVNFHEDEKLLDASIKLVSFP